MSNVFAMARGPLAIQLALAGLRVEQPEPGEAAEAALDGVLREPGATVLAVVQDEYRARFSE